MILSEAELLAQALNQKLPRLVAVVLAHILHHEQLKGGVEIAGQRWRYRTVAEFSSRVGYADRSVARAIAELEVMGLIAKRIIWDPRHSGKRVSAYRALPLALHILEAAQSHRDGTRNRKTRHGDAEVTRGAASKPSSMQDRSCQSDRIIYIQPDIEPDIELVTLPPPARENQYVFLPENDIREETLVEAFQGYLDLKRSNQPSKTAARVFWHCMENAINQKQGTLIEPFDPVVSNRVGTFLALFEKQCNMWLSDIDQCAIAVWAYVEWPHFRNLIFDLTSKIPESSMSSYHLEKYAYLIINEIKRRKSYSEAPSARQWLPGFGCRE